MFERFTKQARRIVVDSVATAADLGADKVRPEHLLLGVARADDSVAARVLAGFGVTADELRDAVTGVVRRAGLTDDEVSALRSVGIDADEVFRRIEEAFGPDAFEEAEPPQRRGWRGRIGSPLEPASKKAIELSLREAIALNHRHIGPEHLLLALLRTGVGGPMGTLLAERGVTYDDTKRRVLAELERAT